MNRPSGSLGTRLASLEARFHGFRAEMLQWRLEHLAYHMAGESRWGLVKLMSDHPFRTLAAGLALGLALWAVAGSDKALQLLSGWLQK